MIPREREREREKHPVSHHTQSRSPWKEAPARIQLADPGRETHEVMRSQSQHELLPKDLISRSGHKRAVGRRPNGRPRAFAFPDAATILGTQEGWMDADSSLASGCRKRPATVSSDSRPTRRRIGTMSPAINHDGSRMRTAMSMMRRPRPRSPAYFYQTVPADAPPQPAGDPCQGQRPLP